MLFEGPSIFSDESQWFPLTTKGPSYQLGKWNKILFVLVADFNADDSSEMSSFSFRFLKFHVMTLQRSLFLFPFEHFQKYARGWIIRS